MLTDPEALRRRRDTANRTLTLLKAALNWAHQYPLAENDSAWRLLKPFRDTGAAHVRFLDAAEQQRLLNASEGARRDLVVAALMSGARFGELARLTVRDFDPVNGTVFVECSKNGKARHVPLTVGGSAQLERLPAAGRSISRLGLRLSCGSLELLPIRLDRRRRNRLQRGSFGRLLV